MNLLLLNLLLIVGILFTLLFIVVLAFLRRNGII